MITSAAVSDEDGPLNDDAPGDALRRAEAKRAEARRGDATMGRIADLAGGWSVGGEAAESDEVPEPKQRAEAKRSHDDPPASPVRASRPPPSRGAPRTSPPPPPRAAPRTSPPPPPRAAPRPTLPAPSGSSAARTSSPSPPPAAPSVTAPAAPAVASALPPAAAPRRPTPSAPPPPVTVGVGSLDDVLKGSFDDSLGDELDAKLDALGALDDASQRSAPPPPVAAKRPTAAPPVEPAPAKAPAAAAPSALASSPPSQRAPSLSDDSIPVTFGGESGDRTMDDDFDDFAKPSVADRQADSGLLFLPKAATTAGSPSNKAASPASSSASSPVSSSASSPASSSASSPASSPRPPSAEPAPVSSGSGSFSSVPVGEFEPTGNLRQVRRKLPDGMSRDGATELAVTESRGDPTMIDSSHLRGDQTELREARSAAVADTGIAATLRHVPSLPRRRGVWGDLRYVFTVLVGTRRARRELRMLEREQQERERDRRRHLITLGRAAATLVELDQTQIRRTRGSLQVVDQDRSNQAAQVAASDAESEQVRKERAFKAVAHREEIEKLELEQAQLKDKLEPMHREAQAARRKATDLRSTLQRLDERINNVEAGKGKWADAVSQAAEMAALRAERQGVTKDEPIIAAQLDALVPRIASIEASRERLRRKVIELNEEEEEDAKRSDELLSAIAAKRKVVERATGDAEKTRERMLAELGERLYVDRPSYLSAQLSPIDSLDLELGDGQRRMMELKEILSSIDRWKQARGIVGWLLLLGVIGAGVWFWQQGQLPFLPPP